jgi:hypothetical protein
MQGRFSLKDPSLVARLKWLQETWHTPTMSSLIAELVRDHERQDDLILCLLGKGGPNNERSTQHHSSRS